VYPGGLLHVFVQEQPERRCQFGTDAVLVIDVELVEERLIELSPNLRACRGVGRLAVLHQGQRLFEPAPNFFDAQLGGGEQLFSLAQLSGDPGLFTL
jgi:hypothetical protein